jgi:predicted ATPase
LTPFVGRDEELGLLARRWESVRAGEGQLVLIVGEPGLGKSRLIEEFHARLAEMPHTWVEWSASQLLQNTPLHPIAEWGRLRFGADAPAEHRLADLEGTFRLIGLDPVEHTALVAPLVEIPLPPGREAAFPPEELRRRQLAALVTWVLAGARSQPVVLAFEDLQWADPTSLDLLRALAERGGQAPLFLIATSRPEFRPSWAMRSHHSAISLAPLKRVQVYQMVGELASRHALAKDVVEGVSERTGGVPLFVEEVTRLLLERGAQGGVQAIPPTLQQSLAARLDRLGPAREVAQIGAVLGREFAYPLLRDVAELDESTLQASLERLADADLLFVKGVTPQSTYRFKHALIQEAAYETPLKSRRHALHRRAAEVIIAAPDPRPELVAHHFTQAGETELAIEWWGKAGDAALRRSALVEAAAQLNRALDQFASLPITAALRREQIRLQVALITPVMHVKGYAAPETKAAAERARLLIEQAEALGEPPEDPLLLFSVLHGFTIANYVAFNRDALTELAAQTLALAEKQRATVPLIIGHRLMGISMMCMGDMPRSRAHCDKSLTLYDPAEHRLLATRFGQDNRVASLSYRSITSWLCGYPEAALADTNEALVDARQIGQAATLMYALFHAWFTHTHCGDYATAKEEVEELAALADEKDASFWKALAMLARGELFVLTGRASEAIAMFSSGFATMRLTGSTFWMSLWSSYLARAYAELGQFDDAWRCIGEAMTTETAKERVWEVGVHRTVGEIALLLPEPDAAKANEQFQHALAVARQQQAKSSELRAAMSLARLWRSQGKPQKARELLAPVYGWFTEGFGTRDLREANALLEELTV